MSEESYSHCTLEDFENLIAPTYLSPLLCLHLLQLRDTFISISGHFALLTCTILTRVCLGYQPAPYAV